MNMNIRIRISIIFFTLILSLITAITTISSEMINVSAINASEANKDTVLGKAIEINVNKSLVLKINSTINPATLNYLKSSFNRAQKESTKVLLSTTFIRNIRRGNL
ncbi:MAG: hypothetical protein HQK51_14980 [Oligoflexia bacterium]|nr:hypothetical protein [Oligoflexia bacterium]